VRGDDTGLFERSMERGRVDRRELRAHEKRIHGLLAEEPIGARMGPGDTPLRS
jgi:hypothetical protein